MVNTNFNWKIKLNSNFSPSYGGAGGGASYDDLVLIANALGVKKEQCYDLITNVKVKKVQIFSKGEFIERLRFFYTVETKDGKSIVVEGFRHANIMPAYWGGEEEWDFSDWSVLKISGSYGVRNYQTIVKHLEFKYISMKPNYDMWTASRGTKGETTFDMAVPAVFFSNSSDVLISFGCYNGEVYDADLQKAQNNITKWENSIWSKDPQAVKTWWDDAYNEWAKDFKDTFGAGLNKDSLIKVKAELEDLRRKKLEAGSTNDKDITLAWLQETDRKDAERDLTKIPYQEITKKFIEGNKRIQEIKSPSVEIINNLSEFNEDKNCNQALSYQLKDQNWVLICRYRNFKLWVYFVFKDVGDIENEIKSLLPQLPKGYSWGGINSNKLLDRKPETVEESFIWNLALIWGVHETRYSATGTEWDNWSDVAKNTQKYLIDKTRQQYWDLLPVELKGEGKNKKIQELTDERDSWLASFPNPEFKDKGLTPDKVRIEYDKPKESHKQEDLKPDNLPANWEQQLADLKKWVDAFPVDSFPNGVQDVSALKQKQNQWETIFWTKNPDEIKEWWTSAQNEWNTDFKSDFGDDLKADNLAKVHKAYQDLVEEWNKDFFADFDLKLLSVNSLKAVKERLTTLQNDLQKWTTAFPASKYKDGAESVSAKITALTTTETNSNDLSNLLKDVHDYYVSIGLNQYGEKIDKDSLKNIKDKLDTLTNGLEKWTNAFPIEKFPNGITSVEEAVDDYNEIKRNWNDNFSDYGEINELKSFLLIKANLIILKEVSTTWNEKLNPEARENFGEFSNDSFDKFIVEFNKIASLMNEIGEFWTNNFQKEYGATPNKENLTKVKNKLDDLETVYTNVVNYWNDNISKEYELMPFMGVSTLESLKDYLKDMKDIEDGWKQNKFNEFGEQINKENLKKVRDKLDTLNNNQKPANYDTDINELNEWRTNFPNQTPSGAKQQATQQGSQAAQGTNYLNKLLAIYKKQITEATTDFYSTNLRLDESDNIRPQYKEKLIEAGKDSTKDDYLTLLDKLNGDSDPKQVINSFKIVALICATNKAQELSDKRTDQVTGKLDPSVDKGNTRKNNLIYFNSIKKFWELNKGLEPTESNNPLYLSIIKDKETYKNKLDNILKLWQGKTTRQLRTIDPSIFSIEKTVFGLLQEQVERKDRIEKYIDELKEKDRFPSTSVKIEEYVKKYSTAWDELDDGSSSYDDFLRYFNYYNYENDLIKLVNQDALKEIDQLFAIKDSDDELIKFLKEIATNEEQKTLMKSSFEDLQGGVSWVLFVVDGFKKIYLSHLPGYINDNLNLAEPVKLEEIKEQIKPVLIDLFANLHSGFVKVEVESDLDQFKKDVDDNLEKLKKLISKKNDDLKTAKEKYKKENLDGTAWTLTASETNRIDQAANKEDLEKAVKDIMQERAAAEKVDNWIKDNISSKTKIEELPSEEMIEGTEFSSAGKEKIKWKLQEKTVELMPANKTEEKIKKHLTEVLNKWRKWEYLFDNNRKDDEDYTFASMFNQSFRGTIAKEMEPEIDQAIKTNTPEGYRELDRKWGQGKINKENEVEYNTDREYLEAWKTLRGYLRSDKINKDEWMKDYFRGLHGNDKFQKDEKLYQELQAQIVQKE